jgi:recombination protein RecT
MTQAMTQAQQQAAGFPMMLQKYGSEIQRALPKHMSGDRLARIALTEFRKAPKLANCDPRSVFAAVIMASQLGLEPGINGQSYLIPYGSECQFVPGWKGLVELVNRTGRATAWTGAVFEGDEFEWELGDRPFVRHKPCGEDDPKKMTHVYAVGRINGIDFPIIDVWRVEKVWRHRDKHNKVGQRHYSFRHPEMYARKIPLLQVIKYLPSSIELTSALEMNHAADRGAQRLVDPITVIDGSYAPPVYSEDDVPALENGGADEVSAAPTAAKASATSNLKERMEKNGLAGTPSPPADVDPETGEVISEADPLADLLLMVGEAVSKDDFSALRAEVDRLTGPARARAEEAMKAREKALGGRK